MLENERFKRNSQSSSKEKLFVSGTFKYNNERIHVHIHVTFPGSQEHKGKILFRDYLIKHPDEAEKYYKLKEQWIEHAKNVEEYRELKAPYINEVLRRTYTSVRS